MKDQADSAAHAMMEADWLATPRPRSHSLTGGQGREIAPPPRVFLDGMPCSAGMGEVRPAADNDKALRYGTQYVSGSYPPPSAKVKL